MPNVNQVYQSNYLRADQLKGQIRRLTIEGAAAEVLGTGDQARSKIILKLHTVGPRLVLNKTNANVLAGVFGPETANWVGRVIELRTERVMFSGQLVDSIRVGVPTDAVRPAQAQPAPAAAPPQPVPPLPGGLNEMKDDIPW